MLAREGCSRNDCSVHRCVATANVTLNRGPALPTDAAQGRSAHQAFRRLFRELRACAVASWCAYPTLPAHAYCLHLSDKPQRMALPHRKDD